VEWQRGIEKCPGGLQIGEINDQIGHGKQAYDRQAGKNVIAPARFFAGRRMECGMPEFRSESDSLGQVSVPADRLWGAQTRRSLQYFSIGHELIPREMIGAKMVKLYAATRIG
jgi:hypothetical protein